MSKEEIELLKAVGDLLRLIRDVQIAYENDWISASERHVLIDACGVCIAEIVKKLKGVR